MDKSFNDQELSDIMKEIEALEEGGTHEEEVLTELTEMSESKAIPLRKETHVPKMESSQSAMSFKVQGDMNIDLHFEIGGKSVALKVSESGLHIETDEGMTFSVPLKGKRAA
jgi:hypothetical protein